MSAHTGGASGARLAPTVCGAAALVLSSAALAPLFQDGHWAPVVLTTVVLVALTGVLLRSAGAPLPLVVLGQALVVGVLLTVMYTDSGVLGLLPGPAAVEQLQALLDGAGRQIRDEAVPVAVTTELSALLVLLVGAAALVVDGLVAGVHAPAGAGLVLLCLVAVPASLADEILPWWSFVLGALALLLLLVADGPQRVAHAGPAAGASGLRSPAVLVVVLVAVVLSTVVGTAGTVVGTAGRLPAQGGSGGVGLNPFTQLRGQLDQPEDVDLFTVDGLAQPQYLRSLSLDQFVDDEGWVLSGVDDDLPATDPLDDGASAGTPVDMTVRPQSYVDRWLPVAGTPLQLAGTALSDYSYDRAATTLHTRESQPLSEYSVSSVVPSGSAEELRAAEPPDLSRPGAPDARYYATAGIDPQVADLAEVVAGDAPTALDAATRLTRYFTDAANGFTYDLSTATDSSVGASSDALVDFLTVGKRGFCEQFASSMAAMLRTLGIPSRVGVGFTATSGTPQRRQVRTSDAHAWVEVFFPGFGWVVFDPTPLGAGRGLVPDYVTEAVRTPAQPRQEQPTATSPAPASPPSVPTTVAPAPGAEGADPPLAEPAPTGSGSPWVQRIALVVLGLVLVVAAPAVWRGERRRRRTSEGTAEAAWDELVDLAVDRGAVTHVGESPRQAAQRMVQDYELDERGTAAVHRIVLAVEDAWYGAGRDSAGATGHDGAGLRAALQQAVRGFERARPLSLRDRLLPRSLRRRQQPERETITAGRNDA